MGTKWFAYLSGILFSNPCISATTFASHLINTVGPTGVVLVGINDNRPFLYTSWFFQSVSIKWEVIGGENTLCEIDSVRISVFNRFNPQKPFLWMKVINIWKHTIN